MLRGFKLIFSLVPKRIAYMYSIRISIFAHSHFFVHIFTPSTLQTTVLTKVTIPTTYYHFCLLTK